MGQTTIQHAYFATCPKGLESLLLEELAALGAESVKETVAGVYFDGPLGLAYKACLWSRLANKILMPLARFDVDTADDLYDGVRALDWTRHIRPEGRMLVDFTGRSENIRNTQFGAVKVKDAVVDCLREATGQRPSVDRKTPDLRINVRLSRAKAVVALDLCGESLHRRGYRQNQGEAPLKENLAAAVLIRAGWGQGGHYPDALLDPMCGSGTFLIEAAMMASDTAPGLSRPVFAFERWPGHDQAEWQALRREALERRNRALAGPLPEIRGYDANGSVVRACEQNIQHAGFDGWIRVTRKELKDFTRPTHKPLQTGLIVTNPPYGERLGEVRSLERLYAYLGQRLREQFDGWQAAVLTGNPDLGKRMGLRSHKKYKLFNGAIPSELLLFEIEPDQHVKDPTAVAPTEEPPAAEDQPLSDGATMLANRLRKNQKALRRWLKRESINAYRLYDADMPEYACAIDVYDGVVEGTNQLRRLVHVQEYQPPRSVSDDSAAERFAQIREAVPHALEVPPQSVSYKTRRRQTGKSQYEKLSEQPQGELLQVREGAAQLSVNLWQYLDTGLFLDHRPLRAMIAEQADGKRFLNLFCYTGAATVQAAMGGARFTQSVDLSRTYLDWARRNLALNGLSEARHRLEQADCFEWLKTAEATYDLILLDPPSFSNSKRMKDVLDVQRDHAALIDSAMKRLSPGGTLYFSNNRRGFKLDDSLAERYDVKDITRKTLDPDFARNRKIHQCWTFQHVANL